MWNHGEMMQVNRPESFKAVDMQTRLRTPELFPVVDSHLFNYVNYMGLYSHVVLSLEYANGLSNSRYLVFSIESLLVLRIWGGERGGRNSTAE